MAIDALSPYSQAGFSASENSLKPQAPEEKQAARAGESTNTEQSVQNAPLGTQQLTDSEQRQVQQMKRREAEVRQHEQAHRAAGGRYVRGGINYEYETGPDGKRYIVGGEVSIDTSAVSGDPKATADKMQTIRRAALAPASPSQQDRSVAAQASQAEAQARQEMLSESTDSEGIGETESEGSSAPGEAGETETSQSSGQTGEAEASQASAEAPAISINTEPLASRPAVSLPFPKAVPGYQEPYTPFGKPARTEQAPGQLLNIVA